MPGDAGAGLDAGPGSASDAGGGTDAGPGAGSDAGSMPECDYDDTDVCGGNSGLWCGSGACVACAENMFNCDGTRGCECADGCDGNACLPQNDCVGGVAGECGSDDRWCFTGHPSGTPQCRECSDGFLNCDGVDGCEHTCESGSPCECP